MHDVNASGEEDAMAEAVAELHLRAEGETHPQTRARLWGELIQYVLSLEDIRPGLTFGEIASMTDADAHELANHLRAVCRLERSWRS